MSEQHAASYFFQIEVTTVCNFRCFYCIGRTWRPRHMKMELFESILGRLPKGKHTISLQGEGEPLAHPQFWKMAEKVIESGSTPYTITNGSLVDPVRMSALFPTVGFSIDTIDPAEADRIGRRHLQRVLRRFEALCQSMGPERIIVHSVDLGQNLGPLRDFLAHVGVTRHVVQPLQSKSDYRQRYPGWQLPSAMCNGPQPCHYLTRQTMRFFNVDGRSLPCPFIKDAAGFRSDKNLLKEFAAFSVPGICEGCREIGGVRQ